MPNRGLAASAAALLALACLTAAVAQVPAGQPAFRRPSPRAYRGRWALQAFERVLPQLAQRHGLRPERLRTMLAQDRDVWVDEAGEVLFTCGFPAPPRQPAAAAGVGAIPPFPLENTFQLHSRPGAQRTVYLDFDGHTTSSTSWNFTFTGGAPIVSDPFDTDGDPASFNAGELEAVQQCWQRVAEDYAPLNVDVTTQDPGLEALRRTSVTDEVYGTRVVISPTSSFYPGVGGVAYVGVFNNLNNSNDLPCFVFSENVGNEEKSIAEAASHEAGHTLGLSHDGTSTSGYYAGHGDWAPLMGVGYYRSITQWSEGEYAGANNNQDDFEVMASNGGPLVADDVGDTAGTAATLSGTATGVISTRADLDFFRVNAGAGTLNVAANPASHGANLDIRVTLYDGTGSVLTSADPAGLSATLSRAVTAGTYYVSVDGVGSGSPLDTGYSDYGSLGAYTLTANSTATPTLTVTAPDGGENWQIGSLHNLTWTSTGVSGNVKLEYSTDAGGSWTVIAASTANDGQEGWTVPNAPTTQARVRVSAVSGSPSDTSNANFTISLAPDAYEPDDTASQAGILGAGLTQDRSIHLAGNEDWAQFALSAVSNVDLQATGDTEMWLYGPSSSTSEVAYDAGSGTLARIRKSALAAGTYYVRVRERQNDATIAAYTLSLAVTVPGLTVTSPNGSETWLVGSAHTVTWTSANVSGNVKLEYSTDGGSAWTVIQSDTANDGTEAWTVPDTPTTQARVRVSALDGSAADQSDANFTIAPPPSITVTSPNGGEVWIAGSSQTLTWSSTGVSGSVKLEYSTDSGATWTLIEASTSDDGAQSWTVPQTPTTHARVRVTALDGSAADASDADFTLALPAALTVTAPNGGESWPIGSTHLITWSSTSVPGPVKLQYSTDGGASWTDITTSTPNDGSEAWAVPNTPTTRARIRVSAVDGSASDTSNADFTLSVPGDAYEADDSSGEARVLNPGETQSRSIHVAGNEDWAYFVLPVMSDVDLQATGETELWLYGPNSLTTVAGYDGGTGSLSRIQRSALPAGTYYVRVRKAQNNGVILAYSLSLQVTPCVLTVVSPNGGQAWEVGSSQILTWSSVGVTGQVRLEYSTDGGATWTPLAVSTPNDGSEPWTVPNTPTAQALFRVSAVDDPDCRDTSDSGFSIVPKPGDAYENDNVREQAKPILAGEAQSHSIHQVGDVDWVQFTLTGTRRVTLTTAGVAGGDTLLELYNSAGRRLTSNNDIAAPRNRYSRISNRRLGKGTYYVRVTQARNNGIISAYTLSLQVRR